jgi:hypothetical protein
MTSQGIRNDTFKTFPEFSRLTLEDKDAYESLIAAFPPISDITFAGLLTWWDELDSCSVSLLNGNLIISYWLPGDEKNSGICLLGDNMIDETLCAIFDYQKSQHTAPRLVHVPEFVVTSIRYPEMFTFKGEQDYDESIYAIDDLYPLLQVKTVMRTKIEKFLARHDEADLVLRSLDLRLAENQALLLDRADVWCEKGTFNYVAEQDKEAIKIAINNAPAFDIQNICLFVDGQLAGFQFYQAPHDTRYVIGTFARVNPRILYITEYMFHASAGWWSERGFRFINFEQDLGLAHIRAQKFALQPSNFFRKYTVEPAR